MAARLVFCLLVLSAASDPSPPGTVFFSQKIAANQGGFVGPLLQDNFGSAAASVGDLDGDSVVDMAVGANFNNRYLSTSSKSGAVWILFLNGDGTVKHEQKISALEGNFTGSLAQDKLFGSSLSNLGDINGDQIPDIAVGAVGTVYILLLNRDGTVKGHQELSFEFFNSSDTFVSALGDLDSDGVQDIVVGHDNYGNFSRDSGAVAVFLLNKDGTIKKQTVIGEADLSLGVGDHFGSSVASLGVFNGTQAIAVGASGDDNGLGSLYILFLDAAGGLLSFKKIGNNVGNFSGNLALSDRFGSSVCAVGDLNGDRVQDVAVGAQGDGVDTGAVWILFLNGDGTIQHEHKINNTHGNINGTLALPFNGQFGSSITKLGDVSSAGAQQIAVGARSDNSGEGAVWILALLAKLAPTTTTTTMNEGWTGVSTTAASNFAVTATTARTPTVESTGATTTPEFLTGSLSVDISTLFLTINLNTVNTLNTVFLTTTASKSSNGGPATTSEGRSEDGLSVVMVVGIAVGVLVLLAIAALALVLARRRKGRARDYSSGVFDLAEAPVNSKSLLSPQNLPTAQSISGEQADPSFTDNPDTNFELGISPEIRSAVSTTPRTHDAGSAKVRDLDERFHIQFDEIKLGTELASGNFGVVHRGEYTANECVIKLLKSKSQEARAGVLREALQLAQLRPHASICAFYGACLDPDYPLCLVTEYIEGGNLGAYLQNSAERVRGRDVVNLSRDLAAGMTVLHRSNVLHLDLAARNLLVVLSVESPLKLRICDFGLSQTIPKDRSSVSAEGCPIPWRWTPPEVALTRSFDKATDLWAFGICVYQMLDRCARPYSDLATNQVLPFVAAGHRLACPDVKVAPQVFASDRVVDVLYDLMLRCWNADPALRPAFSTISEELAELLTSSDNELDDFGIFPVSASIAEAGSTAKGGTGAAYSGSGNQYAFLYAATNAAENEYGQL